VAIAVTKSVKQTVSGTTTAVATLSNTTTGRTLVALTLWDAATTFSSFVDSAGNTWTQAGTELDYSPGKWRVYYCINATGAATHTFTFTIATSATLTLVVWELSDVDSFIGFTRTTDAATPFASGTVSIPASTVAGVLSIAGLTSSNSNDTVTWTNGSTSFISEVDGSNYWTFDIGFERNAAQGSGYTDEATCTAAFSTTVGIGVLAFSEYSGPPPAAQRVVAPVVSVSF
jgi:hypothetical protein